MAYDWSSIQDNQILLASSFVLAGVGLSAIVANGLAFLRKRAGRRAQMVDSPHLPEITFSQYFIEHSSAMLKISPGSGAILDANPAAEIFYGSTRAALRSTTIYTIIQAQGDEINQAIKLALEGHASWVIFPLLLASGEQRMVEGQFSALALNDQPALCLLLHDVTDRVKAQEILKANESYYHALVEASPDSVMLASQQGTIIACNAQLVRLYGYTSINDMVGLNFFSLFPSYGREVIREKIFSSQRGNNFECIMLRADGSSFNGELSVSIITDAAGMVDKVIVICRDITKRKEMEAALNENEMRYRIVAENTYDWEFWQTPDQELIYSSPSCKRVTGYDADAFLHDPGLMNRIIYSEDRTLFATRQRAIREKREPAEWEFRIVTPTGEVRWISQVVQPVFDDQGFYMGMRGSSRDVTQRKLIEANLQESEARLRLSNEQLSRQVTEIEQLHQELRDQALRDPLTGLFNRRYLSETMPREMGRAMRENRPISFILMDIDHFKRINDTYGHQLGDVFIQKIANELRSHTRSSDIACRYGGEEFLLVMLGANEVVAFNRAEDLRMRCAAIEVMYQDEPLHITISLGIASYPTHGTTEEILLKNADVALYWSKGSGRNLVTVWHPE